MRPESIQWFERVYIVRIVVGIALSLYSFYWMSHAFGAYPMPAYGLKYIAIGSVVMVTLINLLLLYFIARRASVVAKWIFVVATLIGLVSVVHTVIAPNFLPALLKMGPLFGVGLDFTMIMLLFQPDSRDWFEGGGVVEDDYADTFS
jgi:hypothetical protein